MHHIDTCCINFDAYLTGLQIFNSKQFEIEHFKTINCNILVVKRNVNVNNNRRKCVYVRECVCVLFLHGPSNNPHSMYTFTWKYDDNKKKSMFIGYIYIINKSLYFRMTH